MTGSHFPAYDPDQFVLTDIKALDSGPITTQKKLYQIPNRLFEKGLGADPLAEEFYRHLMTCYQAMDLRAEAIAVYRRCEKTLAAGLGVPPAAKTFALYQKLQS